MNDTTACIYDVWWWWWWWCVSSTTACIYVPHVYTSMAVYSGGGGVQVVQPHVYTIIVVVV